MTLREFFSSLLSLALLNSVANSYQIMLQNSS